MVGASFGEGEGVSWLVCVCSLRSSSPLKCSASSFITPLFWFVSLFGLTLISSCEVEMFSVQLCLSIVSFVFLYVRRRRRLIRLHSEETNKNRGKRKGDRGLTGEEDSFVFLSVRRRRRLIRLQRRLTRKGEREKVIEDLPGKKKRKTTGGGDVSR